MDNSQFNLLLADDDTDDCLFFKDALDDLRVSASLKTVNNGIALMNLLLGNSGYIPDVLFLDLNMHLKSGIECLSEIKLNDSLKSFPIIIFSTSLDMKVVDLLYEKGAHYYIRKPGDFTKLKNVILEALTIVSQDNYKQPEKDKFVIQS